MQLSDGTLTSLRTGTNSQLYRYDRQDLSLVLKCVNQTHPRQTQHLLNEYNILKQIVHPNVVHVYKCMHKISIPGHQGNYHVLAQEYACFGNLGQLFKNHQNDLEFVHRRFLFWQIAITLQHLHGINIVHRDIKLDNILVNEDQENQGLKITIADFGFALQLQEGQLVSSFKGTKRGYMAPEIHQVKTNPNKQYCPKATDVFALGVVLYALVMGRLPFEYATPEDRHYKFIAKEDQESFWNMQALTLQKLKVSSDSLVGQFKDLFMKMVTCNPKERLKIQEVLQHPWLLGKKKQPEL